MSSESEAVFEAASRQFDISWVTQQAQSAITNIENEMTRPSVLFRPKVSLDGSYYCVLYGDDLMSGCSGFGKTLNIAMRDFDANWEKQHAPRPQHVNPAELTQTN